MYDFHRNPPRGNRSIEVGRIHTGRERVHGLLAESFQLDRNKTVNLVGFLLQGKVRHEVFGCEQFTDFSVPDLIQKCDGIGFR